MALELRHFLIPRVLIFGNAWIRNQLTTLESQNMEQKSNMNILYNNKKFSQICMYVLVCNSLGLYRGK
jgi:hypothetical protein